MFLGGGDLPEPPRSTSGCSAPTTRSRTGAIASRKIYNGENWNPELQRAAHPARRQRERPANTCWPSTAATCAAADDVYSFFQETAGKQVVLKVGPNPDGNGRREVTVVPVDSEPALRHLAWIEDNRRKVDQMTGGRVAYVHLPDTAAADTRISIATSSPRSARRRPSSTSASTTAADLADYIIDHLRRPLMSYWSRARATISEPGRRHLRAQGDDHQRDSPAPAATPCPGISARPSIGPLVGKRTWGGLVGICDYPQLHRWRLSHSAARSPSTAEGRVGSREPRHRAGRRGGHGPGPGPPGTRSAAGKSGRSSPRASLRRIRCRNTSGPNIRIITRSSECKSRPV